MRALKGTKQRSKMLVTGENGPKGGTTCAPAVRLRKNWNFSATRCLALSRARAKHGGTHPFGHRTNGAALASGVTTFKHHDDTPKARKARLAVC